MLTKSEFIKARTNIISEMLDNPDDCGIYKTTRCFAKLDDIYDKLTGLNKTWLGDSQLSWAQLHQKEINNKEIE